MRLAGLTVVICLFIAAAVFFGFGNHRTPPASPEQTSKVTTFPSNHPPEFTVPIDRAGSRVTKKSFAIKVSPNSSPVSPERFSGYHTGIDFETFADEQDRDVPVYAICTGSLVVKKIAQGYGGVVVQACKYQNRDITVIYGHLKLSSISANIGGNFRAGEPIGILGKGFSTETGYSIPHDFY